MPALFVCYGQFLCRYILWDILCFGTSTFNRTAFFTKTVSTFCSVTFSEILNAILKSLFMMLKNFKFLFIFYFLFN